MPNRILDAWRALRTRNRHPTAQQVAAVASGQTDMPPYSQEYQARDGRAWQYYDRFRNRRGGGLWGACLLIVDLQGEVAKRDSIIAAKDRALREAALVNAQYRPVQPGARPAGNASRTG